MTFADKRREAERRGRRAETLAAWLLRLKGYRVLARPGRLPRHLSAVFDSDGNVW